VKKTARRMTPQPRRAGLLNKGRCDRAAGVVLNAAAFADLEGLSEYCQLYVDPGAEGRRAPLFMAADFREPATREQHAGILLLLVEGVAQVCRANKIKRDRLNRLVASLFKQTGTRPPAPRTLRRAVQAVYN
jgi:hypothetical protein